MDKKERDYSAAFAPRKSKVRCFRPSSPPFIENTPWIQEKQTIFFSSIIYIFSGPENLPATPETGDIHLYEYLEYIIPIFFNIYILALTSLESVSLKRLDIALFYKTGFLYVHSEGSRLS